MYLFGKYRQPRHSSVMLTLLFTVWFPVNLGRDCVAVYTKDLFRFAFWMQHCRFCNRENVSLTRTSSIKHCYRYAILSHFLDNHSIHTLPLSFLTNIRVNTHSTLINNAWVSVCCKSILFSGLTTKSRRKRISTPANFPQFNGFVVGLLLNRETSLLPRNLMC